MTNLIDTVQLQEIGDALVELYDVTLPNQTVVHLFNGLDEGATPIYFSNAEGTTKNQYAAIPITVSGMEIQSSGALARPTLEIANIPVLTRQIGGDEDTLLDILENDAQVTTNEDLLGSTIVVRRTLLKYTQSAAEAAALPVEFPSHKFILDRVSAENNLTVQFELASPMDVEGVTLPARVVVGKYCPWRYQGVFAADEGGCNWTLDSEGRFFDQFDAIITKNVNVDIPVFSPSTSYTYISANSPVRVQTTDGGHTKIWRLIRTAPAGKTPSSSPAYWYREDVCGKLINSCKIRFQGNNTDTDLNLQIPLPFGGFPGSKQFK
jgi:lambda family phage minor tail protein L